MANRHAAARRMADGGCHSHGVPHAHTDAHANTGAISHRVTAANRDACAGRHAATHRRGKRCCHPGVSERNATTAGRAPGNAAALARSHRNANSLRYIDGIQRQVIVT